MKIEILCPRCAGILRHNSSAVKLGLGGSYGLEVECVNCNKSMIIEVIIHEPSE
jgi:hypothetical protein